MRILSLRFRNLNSLAGDWSIDFCAPEYEANGIFAITGPTGSGKSTILDAICLALYGCTPRLPNISKSVNDIMTRGTGNCFADVTFRTSQGDFRCRWSQRRAHGKADGDLQQPQHELFDAEGKSLADKIKDVAAKIIELTGMDVERFTQSTLLAQGRFATFLMANGRDRAPLLEQLTGTGIYSALSTHIFERHKLEQSKLDTINVELAHCNVLSQEEERALMDTCAQLSVAIGTWAEKEKALNADLHLLQLCSTLAKEHSELLALQNALDQEENAFAGGRARLETARRALLLSGDCSALLVQQKEQENDHALAHSLTDSLIPLSEAVQTEEARHVLAEQALTQERTAYALLLETLKEVRALDVQIRERGQESNQRETAAKKTAKQAQQIKESLEKREALLQKCRRELEEAKLWLESHASDADLPQTLSALRISAMQLIPLKKRIETRSHTLQTASEELERTTQACEKQSLLHGQLAAEHDSLSIALAELENERLRGLDGKTSAEWRKEQEELSSAKIRLERMLELAQTRSTLQERCAALTSSLVELEQNIDREQSVLLTEQASLNDVQNLRQELAETLALLERIQGFEEARLQLRDGEACPLCGAVHHPFAEGNIPVPDQKKEQLHDCEQRIASLNDTLGKRRTRIAGLERDKAYQTSLLEEKKAEETQHEVLILQEVSCLPAWLPSVARMTEQSAVELLCADLLESRQFVLERLKDVNSVLTLAEERQAEIEQLRKTQSKIREQTERSLHGLRELEQKKSILLAEVRTQKAELDADRARLENDFDAVRLTLTPLGHMPQSAEDIPDILQRLTEQLDSYQYRLREAEELVASCTELEKHCLLEAQELRTAEKNVQSLGEDIERIEKALSSLKEHRRILMGEKEADAVEVEALQQLHKAEAELKASLSRLEILRKERDDSTSRLAVLEKRLEERSVSLVADQKALTERLEKQGFSSLQTCLDACLTEKEREYLERCDQELHAKKTGLIARLLDNERRRSELEDPPAMPEEELQLSLREARSQQAAMQEELGATREKLENNEAQKNSHFHIQQSKARQVEECRRWADLNKLIGSSDGQKFRNYAQELTFRTLLRHANRQLSAMTDRYVLVQTPKEALSLSVIDRYQADTVRTARNLSGGESFLVSLSLALGLAQMASRSVRVDSVFLDEGFGTLDDESLSIALDMLAGLRQQGKTIGIISHVQAIRERIGTRIQVEAEGNGRSRLTGPGIRKT